MKRLVWLAALACGCGSSAATPDAGMNPDLAMPADLLVVEEGDLATAPDLAPVLPTAAEFMVEVVQLRCQRLQTCGFLDAAQESSCETFLRSFNLDFDGIPAALAAGRIAYDPIAAQGCLDAWSGSDCTYAGYALPIHTTAVEACARVFSGNVAQGGACCFGFQCQDDAACTAGKCAAPGPCGSCTPNDNCINNACVARPDVGQTCAQDGSIRCKAGLVCIPTADYLSGTCGALGVAGDRCFNDFQTNPCGAGLYCDFTLAQPVCALLATIGQDCGDTTACAAGLLCPHADTSTMTLGKCAPPIARDGACSLATSGDTGCKMFEQCNGTTCDLDTVLGSTCSMTCDLGYCDLATNTCKPAVPEGGACTPGLDSQCEQRTACDAVTSTCSSASLCM